MTADILRPQFGPKPVVTTDEYFGGCPKCGKTNGYVNNGRHHWFCCDTHRTKWYVGSNLFSSWHEPKSPEEEAHTTEVIGTYEIVEPVKAPATPQPEIDTAVVSSPEDKGRWLNEDIPY